MKVFRKLLIAVSIIAIVVGCWNLLSIQLEYRRGKTSYVKLESHVSVPTQPAPAQREDTAAETESVIAFPEVDFRELQKINPQIVGWIYCEGTGINYPIAQGKDNRYYLEHVFDRQANGSGCIFLDCTNSSDFSDRNSVIYGHNMKNGTMFASLLQYKDQAYYEAHPRLLLVTPEKNYTIELFAGYVLSGWGNAWMIGFADDATFGSWLTECTERSCFRSPIVPTSGDRVLTLSTCTYEYDDARFVVQGILREA